MKRVINLPSLIGTVSVALFVIVEFLAAAAAFVWAFSGLFGLGETTSAALAVAVAVPTLYASARISVMAYEAETDPENN